MSLLLLISSQFSEEKRTFDFNIHDTYFIIADHQFYVVLAIIFGLVGLLYLTFFILKLKLSSVLIIAHFISWILFLSQFYWLGMIGIPERYYTNTSIPAEYNGDTKISFFIIGLLCFIFNITIGIFKKFSMSKNP